MKYNLLPILITTLAMAGCHNTDKPNPPMPAADTSFIAPPIKGVEVGFKEDTIDAAKGDTLFYPSGSIALFPPNAFIDKDNNIIKGRVRIRYREFRDPLDIYLAGITMKYDSAGQSLNLQSAGMFEMLAYKDGVPVYINPKSRPEINLASSDTSGAFNIYYLDTVQRKWTYQDPGGPVIPLKNSTTAATSPTSADTASLAEPVKPEKMTNKSPVIRIEIDTSTFKELAVYNNLRMQLEGKNFNPKDTTEEWNTVQLTKTTVRGLYRVVFTNANRAVTYDARPVLDTKDYDEALHTFEKNNAEYKKRLKDRIKAAKTQKAKMRLEDQRMTAETRRMNALIAARNKKIEALNARFDSANKVMRTYSVPSLGIWNCDRIIQRTLIPVRALFTDDKGDTISLKNIAVMYEPIPSVTGFAGSNILVVGNKQFDYMIVGSCQGRFAYITFTSCRSIDVKRDQQVIYPMTVLSEKDNNYEYIKGLYNTF